MKNLKAILLFTFATGFTALIAYAYFTGPPGGGLLLDAVPSSDTGKRIEIVYWDLPQWRGLAGTRLERNLGYDVWSRRKVAEYEAMHPEVRIRFSLIPWQEENDKYRLAANAGEAPDVYYRDAGSVHDLAHRGLIYPIDDYITQEDLDDWYPQIVEDLVVNGRMYGWPFLLSYNAIAVNVDLFRERGAEDLLPKPPDFRWTYEQFLEAARATTFKRKTPSGEEEVWGYIVHGIGSEHLYTMWTDMNGSADFYNYDHTAAEIYTPQRLETWRFLVDLIFKYGVSPRNSSGISYQEAWRLFLHNQLAMFPGGMWVVREAEAQAPEPFEIINVLPPSGSYRPVRTQEPYIGAYVVSKRNDSTPERVQVAMDFARFLTNTRNDAAVYGNSTLPVRRSAGNPYYGDRRFQVFFWLLRHARPRNPDWKFEHLTSASQGLRVDAYYQMMISGQKTPETVLREMQEEQRQLLEREREAGYPKRFPRKVLFRRPSRTPGNEQGGTPTEARPRR